VTVFDADFLRYVVAAPAAQGDGDNGTAAVAVVAGGGGEGGDDDDGNDIKVMMHWSALTNEYVFRHDTKSKAFINGRKGVFYLKITNEDLEAQAAAVSDVQSRRRRVAEYRVYGNSSRCKDANNIWNKAAVEGQLERISQHLATEEKIAAIVRAKTVAPYEVRVRFSKGVVDHHDMDVAAGICIGPRQSLDGYAAAFGSLAAQARPSDAPTRLLVVPLYVLLLPHDEQLARLVDLAGLGEEMPKPELNHHLKEVSSHVRAWQRDFLVTFEDRQEFPLDELFTEEIGLCGLISIYEYPDATVFSVQGSTRRLSETPWETFVRSSREEAVMDLSRSLVRFRGDPMQQFDASSAPWEVMLQTQVSTNMYFVLHSSSFDYFQSAKARYAARAPRKLGRIERWNRDEDYGFLVPSEGGGGEAEVGGGGIGAGGGNNGGRNNVYFRKSSVFTRRGLVIGEEVEYELRVITSSTAGERIVACLITAPGGRVIEGEAPPPSPLPLPSNLSRY